MDRWLEEKYLRLIGGRFRNFKQKSKDVYNWSCHSCGDSHRDQRKARAYAYVSKKGRFNWTCHNCSDGGSVTDLVKQVDEELFREMLMENFEGSDRGRELAAMRASDEKLEAIARRSSTGFSSEDEEEPELLNFDPNRLHDMLPSLRELPDDHQARVLAKKRMIPYEEAMSLFHADQFYSFANQFVPGKYDQVRGDEPRLIIPFWRAHKLIGFQGRSYGDARSKYISVVVDKDAPFLYGWNRLDGYGDAIALEGPIDSMFLRNGVATGGGSIQAEIAKTGIPKEVWIVVYDNEPRNKHTVKKMVQAVEDGYRVCVWPENFREKDVNDMIMKGVPAEQVQAAIETNAFSGLEAQLMIATWKRCQI
jgi:hypothetical protein